MATSRRPVNPSRRVADIGVSPSAASLLSKSRSSSYLSVVLIVLEVWIHPMVKVLIMDCSLRKGVSFVTFQGVFLLIGYFYHASGPLGGGIGAVTKVEGDFSCTVEVRRAIPILKRAYGDSMHKVLHVGPDTCSVVSALLKEEDTEAWGVEPYDIEDADRNCKNFVQRGIVRVADIKFPLPYRAKSFSLVIVSDALDYLSPRYLNRTLPELARVSSDGLIIFAGYPHHHKAKGEDKSTLGRSAKLRSATWWVRYFVQTSLEENEVALKKFEQAAVKGSYSSSCQVFHLKAYH